MNYLPESLQSFTFYHDKERSLLDCPLVATGEMNKLGDDEVGMAAPRIVVHHLKEGETMEDFLLRLHPDRRVHVDCALFAQVVQKTREFESKEDGGQGILMFEIGIQTNPVYRYIHPVDQDAYERLNMSTASSKGMWVLEEGADKYLGMADAGPVVRSLAEWTDYLIKSLTKWSASVEDELCDIRVDRESFFHNTLKRMVSIYLETGRLNHWAITSSASPMMAMVEC